ncbi:hypothetical protein SDC9_181707 [bioreactor metagenome]|uniref:Uncharacterized protein n=1 Tax=bioreactor metagenome TaxID=1076179 RepID=A0A645HDP1_9ZZZZ
MIGYLTQLRNELILVTEVHRPAKGIDQRIAHFYRGGKFGCIGREDNAAHIIAVTKRPFQRKLSRDG